MKIYKDSESQRPIHVLARYAALGLKPALLWMLIMSGNARESGEIGKLMLSAALVSIVLGNESHLKFYRLLFSGGASKLKLYKSLFDYIKALFLHIILMLPFVCVVSIFIFPAIEIWQLIILGIAERIADEILRIQLYRKEWSRWTLNLLLKYAVPSIGTLSFAFMGSDLIAEAYTISSMLFAAYLLFVQTEKNVVGILVGVIIIPTNINEMLSYFKKYLTVLFPRQMTSVLAVNFILLDRFVGMNYWKTEQVGLIILIGQIISGVFFLTEAKYLSAKRTEFIDERLRFHQFWRWGPYIKVLFLCGLISVLIINISQYMRFLPEMTADGAIVVIFMILNTMIYLVAVPLNDYLYYRGKTIPLVIMHVILSVIYYVIVVLMLDDKSPVVLAGLLIGFLLLRVCVLKLYFKRYELNAT